LLGTFRPLGFKPAQNPALRFDRTFGQVAKRPFIAGTNLGHCHSPGGGIDSPFCTAQVGQLPLGGSAIRRAKGFPKQLAVNADMSKIDS
jgi:hypothetical protein